MIGFNQHAAQEITPCHPLERTQVEICCAERHDEVKANVVLLFRRKDAHSRLGPCAQVNIGIGRARLPILEPHRACEANVGHPSTVEADIGGNREEQSRPEERRQHTKAEDDAVGAWADEHIDADAGHSEQRIDDEVREEGRWPLGWRGKALQQIKDLLAQEWRGTNAWLRLRRCEPRLRSARTSSPLLSVQGPDIGC